MFFVPVHQNKGVNDLKNHITQIPIGTSTSNMIHDTPLITKNHGNLKAVLLVTHVTLKKERGLIMLDVPMCPNSGSIWPNYAKLFRVVAIVAVPIRFSMFFKAFFSSRVERSNPCISMCFRWVLGFIWCGCSQHIWKRPCGHTSYIPLWILGGRKVHLTLLMVWDQEEMRCRG